ncbi:sulfite exporter TauE/SafE family protein [Piscinibacter sp.]|uniref:sulfite exporter TauE/SafE family protein n=1 Tax=Piscinibacter sp. TaxID=1903157 RepID=UPI0039E2E853
MIGTLAILGVAGLAHGIFGIGFAMIATPLLALFLDYTTSLVLAAIPLLGMSAWWLATHRHALLAERIPGRLLAGIATGSILGVAVQSVLPARASILLLAALLAMSVCLPWLLKRWSAVDPQQVRRNSGAFAALAGFTESSLNVGAPFMVLFGALAHLKRVEQLIVLNLCFFLGKSIQVGLISLTGTLGLTSPAMLLASTAVGLGGFIAGNALAGRLLEATFRRALNSFLIVIVVALLLRAGMSPQ